MIFCFFLKKISPSPLHLSDFPGSSLALRVSGQPAGSMSARFPKPAETGQDHGKVPVQIAAFPALGASASRVCSAAGTKRTALSISLDTQGCACSWDREQGFGARFRSSLQQQCVPRRCSQDIYLKAACLCQGTRLHGRAAMPSLAGSDGLKSPPWAAAGGVPLSDPAFLAARFPARLPPAPVSHFLMTSPVSSSSLYIHEAVKPGRNKSWASRGGSTGRGTRCASLRRAGTDPALDPCRDSAGSQGREALPAPPGSSCVSSGCQEEQS